MDGLLPRGEAAALAERSMAETRRAATLSTLRHGVLTLGGWTVALGACGVAWFALRELHTRPVPEPQVYVSIVWADRTLPPKLRRDLTAAEREVVRLNTFARYVRCREEYVWAALRECYQHVSAMSSPAVRAAYQNRMNDKQDPAAPRQYYGDDAGAGTGRIDGRVNVYPDRREPNHYVATFTLVEERPGKPAARRNRIVRLVYDDGSAVIPYDLQQDYTPLGDVVVWYVNDPDRAAQPVPPLASLSAESAP